MSSILLVEDSPTIVSAIENLLRREGYQTYVARDGLTALASIRAFMPDLTLLDILLPHVSGFEVCRNVRRNRFYDRMPIIVMSALTDQRDVLTAYEAGANDYLTKPVQEDQLLATIQRHLSTQPTGEMSS